MTSGDVSKRIADLSPEKRELLLRRMREKQATEPPPTPKLPALVPDPERRYEPFPLTDVQQNYWIGRSGFFDLSAGGTNVYEELEITWTQETRADRVNRSVQRALKRLTGRRGFFDLSTHKTNLLVRRLELALRRVIERHDMLRTIILPDGRQQILPEVPPYRIDVTDLRDLPPAEAEAALGRVRERMLRARAPIDRWPLFEVIAQRLDGERLRIQMRLDALLIDGRSRGVFLRQLLLHLGEPDLPALECSYRDYALAWGAFQESDACRRDRDYWLGRLPDLPPAPDLPLARPLEPRTPAFFVSRMLRLLEPDAWGRFKARAARAGLTPSAALAAAYADILAAWSASPRFTIVIEGSYRPPIHPQIDEIIGNFNTIYPLAVEPWPGTFEARARRLQEQMAADLEHRNFSGFRALREWNRLSRSGARASLPIFFNSVIEYRHASYQQPAAGQPADAPIASREVDVRIQFPQILILPTHAEDDDGALVCQWQSADAAFPDGMIEDMIDAYVSLLQRLAAGEDAWQATGRALAPAAQLARRAAANPTGAPKQITPARGDVLERQLAELLEGILERRPIGALDNFFDLGGDSFAAARLMTAVREQLGRELSLAQFYQEPTLAHLAAMIEES